MSMLICDAADYLGIFNGGLWPDQPVSLEKPQAMNLRSLHRYALVIIKRGS